MVPKSVTPSRIAANLKVVALSDDDFKLLTDYSDKLTKEGKLHRYVFPPFGLTFGFPDKE